MLFDEIEIPEALLEAQNANRLVIFAGAGVSMGGVSNYPSFARLADQIVEGVYKRLPGEDIDKFLGRIEAKGVRVREIACRLLNSPASLPNPIHEDLVRLFAPRADLRLVTTNFDNHFSTVIGGRSITKYHTPALPMGENFSGLVYLHGSVENGPSSLVLTDSDFGSTYLAEGRTARFVQAMLSHYTVLFVGYSYNDPLPFYLTRGMGRAIAGRHYVFTPDDRADFWTVLGVTPVTYRQMSKDDHSALGRVVKAWANLTQMRPAEHKTKIKSILNSQDTLSANDSEYLHYAVRRTPTVWFFTREALESKWLMWADEMQLLEPLCNPEGMLYGTAGSIAQWFANQFARGHVELALKIIESHGGKLHPALWMSFTGALIPWNGQSVSGDVLHRWIPLLVGQAPRGQGHEWLDRLFGKCDFPEHEEAIILILEHLLAPKFRLTPLYAFSSTGPSVTGEIYLDTDVTLLRNNWAERVKPHLPALARRLAPFLTAHLIKAHALLKAVGRADASSDPMSLSRAAVEPHNENAYGAKANILIDCARDTLESLLITDREQGRALITLWFGSGVPVLRRLAVHGVRIDTVLEPAEKVCWVLERGILFEYGLKHEVYGTLRDVYPRLGEADRVRLLKEVSRGPSGEAYSRISEASRQYIVFDLLHWLYASDPECLHVSEHFSAIQAQFPHWTASENPNLWTWSTTRIADPPPMTVEELLQKDPGQEAANLADCLEANEGTRYALLELVRVGASQSFAWGVALANALVGLELWESMLWEALFSSWEMTHHTAEEWEALLTLWKTFTPRSNWLFAIARMLEGGMKNKEAGIPQTLLPLATNVADNVWLCLSNRFPDEGDWGSKSGPITDHPGAHIATFWLCFALFLRRNGGEQWKNAMPTVLTHFETMLRNRSPLGDAALFVLAAHVHWILDMDVAWSRKNLFSILRNTKDATRCRQAWQGLLSSAPGKFAKHWRAQGLRLMALFRRFFRRLHEVQCRPMLLSRHVVWICGQAEFSTESLAWLWEYLKQCSATDRQEWASHVMEWLDSLDVIHIETLWRQWLRDYIDKRTLGLPIPLEGEELWATWQWLLQLGDSFVEGVELLCSIPPPKIEPSAFFYQLAESLHCQTHPESVAHLIDHLLEDQTEPLYACDYIDRLIRQIRENGATDARIAAICDHAIQLGCLTLIET